MAVTISSEIITSVLSQTNELASRRNKKGTEQQKTKKEKKEKFTKKRETEQHERMKKRQTIQRHNKKNNNDKHEKETNFAKKHVRKTRNKGRAKREKVGLNTCLILDSVLFWEIDFGGKQGDVRGTSKGGQQKKRKKDKNVVGEK